LSQKIKDIMVPNPVYLKPMQTVFTAHELMILSDYECLFVVDDDMRPVGMVTTLHASVEDSKKKVDRVMVSEYEVLREDQSITEAAQIFTKSNIHHLALPVVDTNGVLVGILRVADLVRGVSSSSSPSSSSLTPEATCIQIAMTKDKEQERSWIAKSRELGYAAAVTQVGTSAEKLPIKMREYSIVAAIAHGVIQEDTGEKIAVSQAVREIILQMDVISPGLGGGFKMAIVKGEGRVAVAAAGRCGHALASSPEQVFLGISIV